ncbi:MAG: hypothetical protein ACQUHE_13290, partial [Bacteroidia bacterium]
MEIENINSKKSLIERKLHWLLLEKNFLTLKWELQNLQEDLKDFHIGKTIDLADSLLTEGFKELAFCLLEQDSALRYEIGLVLVCLARIQETHHFLLDNFFQSSSPLTSLVNISFQILSEAVKIQKEQRFCQIFSSLFSAVMSFLERNVTNNEHSEKIRVGLKYLKYIAEYQYPDFLLIQRFFDFADKITESRFRKTALNVIGNLASHEKKMIVHIGHILNYSYESLILD